MDDEVEVDVEVDEQTQFPTNPIPLFIKKLWKMVNDKDAENIISWNETGDSFIIHDQLQFIIKLLPRYFKHNNMASFVRQLNFYSFHKVPNVKSEIQFAHSCFMKDLPQILPFIRRKNPVIKQQKTKTVAQFKEEEVQGLLNDIRSLKGKHTLVNKELSNLKQENVALWNELNSLRLKYTKQSTIINMLIHFLITYIHSHQSAFSKPNIQVSRGESSRNNIKVGPTLLEIGYKNNKRPFAKSDPAQSYTVVEPGTSSSITYVENKRPKKNTPSIHEMLTMEDQTYPAVNIKRPKKRPMTYSIKLPNNQTEQLSRPEIQASLLEILKENQRLCDEETDDMFSEFESETENLSHINDPEPSVDITENEPDATETTAYTISYPSEISSPVADSPEYLDISDITPRESLKTEEILPNQVVRKVGGNIVKEIPIKTKQGTLIYKISHPDVVPSILTPSVENVTNKLNVTSKPVITKHKFKKLPMKSPTNLIKVSPVESPASVSQNLTQNLNTSASTNPEGALLEILKENEELTAEAPLPDVSLSEVTNIDRLLSDPIDNNFDDFYENVTDAPVGSSTEPNLNVESRTVLAQDKSGKPVNFSENPKEHLAAYVDNTQEELNMLQDILNNLTSSSDLSELLTPPTTDINLDSEEIGHENEPLDDYVNMEESVDKYFKENFLNFKETD